MPNPVKSLRYSAASVAPDLIKALAILSDTTARRPAFDREDIKPYWKSEKKVIKDQGGKKVINKSIIYRFFKDFTKHGKTTKRSVFFSCIPFTNILKYRKH